MFKVNVAPDMGMYNLLRTQGYDPAYALAEFIDNALQAHLRKSGRRTTKVQEPIQIDIKFYSADYGDPKVAQSIVIKDTGPGISGTRLADAMKPAKPASEKGLNEFGIGMKAAAVWFTDTWSLSTVPAKEAKRFWLDFDLQKLLRTSQEKVVVKEEASAAEVGTEIKLKKTRRTIDFARFEAICTELRDIYQRFTGGPDPRMILIAHFNETPKNLKFDATSISPVLSAPLHKIIGKQTFSIGKPETWTVGIDTVFKGVSVTGSISILEKGSYKANPGLVMFRHERVICGTTQKPYLPEDLFGTGNKYSRQRVYGHIFVDDLPVTYTKDRFDFDEAEFAAQLLVNPDLVRLLAQAEAYRTDDTKVTHVAKESEINGTSSKPGKTAKPAAKTPPSAGATKGVGGKVPPKAKTPASPPQPVESLVKILTNLQASPVTSVALQAIIAETLMLYRLRRDIAIAMCFRVILEAGLLTKMERSHAAEYPKVSSKGVASLIDYLASNSATFFDPKADYRLIKSLGSISNGTQLDVVLLNNAAHGHYQPNIAELNRFAANLEPVLNWAYS